VLEPTDATGTTESAPCPYSMRTPDLCRRQGVCIAMCLQLQSLNHRQTRAQTTATSNACRWIRTCTDTRAAHMSCSDHEVGPSEGLQLPLQTSLKPPCPRAVCRASKTRVARTVLHTLGNKAHAIAQPAASKVTLVGVDIRAYTITQVFILRHCATTQVRARRDRTQPTNNPAKTSHCIS
jgi:hypothetical protein